MKDRDWMKKDPTVATGGCQCGAVRYHVTQPLGRSVLCHCRMCQRATGNAFAPLVRAEGTEFTGTPARFASSEVADRGFCGTCGTPLFYDGHQGQGLYLMVGSLDNPGDAPPVLHCGTESQLAWLSFSDSLPTEATKVGGLSGNTPVGFLSHQYSGGSEATKEDT